MSTNTNQKSAVSLLQDLLAYPEGVKGVLTGDLDDLKYRIETPTEGYTLAVIHGGELEREGLISRFQIYGREKLHKGSSFRVVGFETIDNFVENFLGKTLLHALFIQDGLRDSDLEEKIRMDNLTLAGGEKEGQVQMFSEPHLEEALRKATEAQYIRTTTLMTLVVTNKERVSYGDRGVSLLNKMGYPMPMFRATLKTKWQVNNMVTRGELPPIDLLIYDMSKGDLMNYWNSGLLKKILETYPHCCVIAPVTPSVHEQMVHPEGMYYPFYTSLQGKILGLTEFETFRVYRFDEPQKLTPRRAFNLFYCMASEYEPDMRRLWEHLRSRRTSGLPHPDVDGGEITLAEIDQLAKLLPNKVQKDVPLALFSTLCVGGMGSCVVSPASYEDLKKTIRTLSFNEIHYSVIGNCSNSIPGNILGALIRTNSLNRVVNVQIGYERYDIGEPINDSIKLIADYIKKAKPDDPVYLEVEAGVPLPRIAELGRDVGLTGAEFLIRIPGNSGGGVVMNTGVGAQNDMEDIVEGVRVIRPDGQERYIGYSALAFDYRYSALQELADVVYSVILRLQRGDPEIIRGTTKHFIESRKREPLLSKYPSVGSIILRRGYDVPGKRVYTSTDDILEPFARAMRSTDGNIWVPSEEGYTSWVVAKRGKGIKNGGFSGRISPATLYELAEVMYQVGEVANRKKVTLYFEAKFLGFDNNGEPLQNTMQDVLALRKKPFEVKYALLIGGPYLSKW